MANDDAYGDRKRLTFEQAEGVEPLPAQMQPREISPELAARLWAVLHGSIEKSSAGAEGFGQPRLGEAWSKILSDYHVTRLYLPIDEFDNATKRQIPSIKATIASKNYVKIFGFLQFVIRHREKPYRLDDEIAEVLSISRSAYRIFDGNTIIPVSSDQERQTLERAFADLAASEFQGARAHLRVAGAALTAGNNSASIRESIHAVESVARALEPSGSLGGALAKLERSAAIHRALKAGFTSIYGFTSDEQGIRHPLIDEPSAKVDETDALFMIGACAAFVSYLIGKARSAGLLSVKK